MSYKDLLVILDDTPQCAGTTRVAASLARRFDAHLTGLFVVTLPRIPTYIEAQVPPEVFHRQREGSRPLTPATTCTTTVAASAA